MFGDIFGKRKVGTLHMAKKPIDVYRVTFELKGEGVDDSISHYFDFSSEDYPDAKATAAKFAKDFLTTSEATVENIEGLSTYFKVNSAIPFKVYDITTKRYTV